MTTETKDFIIKDKRIFGQGEEDSDEKPEPEKTEETRTQPDRTESPDEKSDEKPGPKPELEQETPLPEINFATFIFSLNASAMVHLGMVEDPVAGEKKVNLSLAKQTIDMLSMLEAKTKGNLTTDEEEMLKHILYDLRMRYVKEKG